MQPPRTSPTNNLANFGLTSGSWDLFPKEAKLNIFHQLDVQSLLSVSRTSKANFTFVNENFQGKKIKNNLKVNVLKILKMHQVKKSPEELDSFCRHMTQLLAHFPAEMKDFLEREIDGIIENQDVSETDQVDGNFENNKVPDIHFLDRLSLLIENLCKKEVFNLHHEKLTPILNRAVEHIKALPAENLGEISDEIYLKIIFALWRVNPKEALVKVKLLKTAAARGQFKAKYVGKITGHTTGVKTFNGSQFMLPYKSLQIIEKEADPNVLVLGLASILKNCYKFPNNFQLTLIDKVIQTYNKVAANNIDDDNKKLFTQCLARAYILAGQIDSANEVAKNLNAPSKFHVFLHAMLKSPPMFPSLVPWVMKMLDSSSEEALVISKSYYIFKMLKNLIQHNIHLEVSDLIKENAQNIEFYHQWQLWKELSEKYEKDQTVNQYREKAALLVDDVCKSNNRNVFLCVVTLLSTALLFAPFDINRAKAFNARASNVILSNQIDNQDLKNLIIQLQALFLLYIDPKCVPEKLKEINLISIQGEKTSFVEELDFFVKALDRFY